MKNIISYCNAVRKVINCQFRYPWMARFKKILSGIDVYTIITVTLKNWQNARRLLLKNRNSARFAWAYDIAPISFSIRALLYIQMKQVFQLNLLMVLARQCVSLILKASQIQLQKASLYWMLISGVNVHQLELALRIMHTQLWVHRYLSRFKR